MEQSVLFAWVGMTDLKACRGELGKALGPIGQALQDRTFTQVVLLSDHDEATEKAYIKWLNKLSSASIHKYHIKLSSPTNFGEIYEAALSTLNNVKDELKQKVFQMTFHISPGTPAMASIWILLAKTLHPAEVIESSLEMGVQTVSLPFDISADYLPHILRPVDNEITKLTSGLPSESSEFEAIIHRSKAMKRVIAKARRIAVHDVPVLIQGESGTGKELLARAIHSTSTRHDKPFIAVNCGAIPPELVEDEFFGHKKGAFSGATQDRKGHFLEANGGTLFLDELGELPLPAQVKLLRAIQEGAITQIGLSKSTDIDVRIIAATNRNLIEEVSRGNFREDLFHRLAVGVLSLPSLRERHDDLNIIIDHIIKEINNKFSDTPGWKDKKTSVSAKNLLRKHSWPGNIRELYNTLSRAAIWNLGDTIQAEDIKESLFPVSDTKDNSENILNRALGNSFSLTDVISDVAHHYLKRAGIEARGNKTLMTKLVGLPNYQTLSNWLKKYKVEN
jgi:DNA-binding NtrC family response regulator